MPTSEGSDIEISPFRIDVPQADLDDLRERLATMLALSFGVWRAGRGSAAP